MTAPSEPKRPAWAQDRLDHDQAMDGSFEGSNAERIGYTIGTLLALVWHAAVWAIALALIVAALYLVGLAMGWS